MAEIQARKKTKEERAAALLEFQERVALDKQFAIEAMEGPAGLLALRLAANTAAQDRLGGKPAIAITGNAGGPIEVNLTRERLADRIARLAAGSATDDGSGEPDTGGT